MSGISLLFILIAIARAMNKRQQAVGGAVGGTWRPTLTYGSSSPLTINVFVRMVFCVVVAGMLTGVALHSPRVARIGYALLVVVSLPSLVLHGVLIPLGAPRAAYWFALVSPPLAHSAEVRGGAVLMGALALVRRRVMDVGAVAFLERRLAGPSRLRSLSVAACGLLAAARGKREGARRLFSAVEGVSPRSPRIARSVARSWLVAEAVERGAFREIVLLGDFEGWRARIRWPHVMALIARRLTDRDDTDPASTERGPHRPDRPTDRALWLAWLLAPHRRATLPLLRRALATPDAREATTDGPSADVSDQRDLLTAALRAHALFLRELDVASLVAAGRAWDAVRGSEVVRALVARRALALEAHTTVDSALLRLLLTAESDLAPHVPRVGGISPPRLAASETLRAAASASGRRAMDEIGSIAKSLATRTREKQVLPVAGEWMEWGALRRLCDRVARDAPPEVNRTLFAAVYSPACNYAVWLFNTRGEKLLANAIFRWLADHAIAGGQFAALEVLQKNVKLGVGA